MTGSGRERLKQRRFEALCEPYRGEVFRFSLWLSRSHQVAEEVVQETLLRAWRSLDSLKDDATAKSWLLTIARREHARLYERKRHPTVNIDELAAAEASCLAATTDRDPDEVQDVRKAIFELEEEHREPLVLQVLMGYSTLEIARSSCTSTKVRCLRGCSARVTGCGRVSDLGPTSPQEDDNGAR